ncbi:hypothetical protein PY650_24415 [Rhizobium calliandrae]|uniref:Uncharacterized protein n=2 Tax=Rhizobium TaxID=379 RepID=A0ABT7KN82_9HYPH|nr:MULTISPECIES: hypothetical protein [Rhizobium]MDL2401579.1 hypothetical protein [Rhizobium mayense]MDL2408728.1 hypothetical protein [Rhizobium calliandrae]
MALCSNNINSVAEAVSLIMALKAGGRQDDATKASMDRALDVIDQAECRGANDAVALLCLSRTLLSQAIEAVMDDEDTRATAVFYARAYLTKAIAHLGTDHALQTGGARLN